MRPTPFILLAALSVLPPALKASPAANAADHSRPNVVLIVSDDQGFGDLSSLGHPVLKTPHLDRLKSESLWMRRFYTSPLCAPTRAQILTGRHQYRTGVWDTWGGRANLAADEKSLANYLHEAGYRTGIFGKWHLGENFPFRPQDRGFDETLIWSNFNRMQPAFSHSGRPVGPVDVFLDDYVVDNAIRFLAASGDSPFFLYVPLYLPHTHWQQEVPASYLEPFKAVPGLTDQEKSIFGMIANVDHNVGRILAAIDRGPQRDNTIVIFVSDNGLVSRRSSIGRYNAGLRGQKTEVYEGGIRVPCFVRWPAKIHPGVTQEMGSVIDLLPTLLEAATGRAPTWANPIDGISLLGLWTGTATGLPRRYLFQQQQPQRSGSTPAPFDNAAVIGEKFKLVSPSAGAPRELYDLSTDEGERENIAARYPDVVRELSEAYLTWFKEMQAGRGFAPNPARLGNPAGGDFRESMIQVQDTQGLPLIIERAGRYEADLLVVQLDQFPEGGELGLTDGKGRVWKAPVGNKTGEIKLDLDLAEGPITLFAYNSGKTRKTGYVPVGEDPGFRQILIRGPLPR